MILKTFQFKYFVLKTFGRLLKASVMTFFRLLKQKMYLLQHIGFVYSQHTNYFELFFAFMGSGIDVVVRNC